MERAEILKRSQTWRLIKLFAETQERARERLRRGAFALFFSRGAYALGGRRRDAALCVEIKENNGLENWL